jgi:transcriptional regulator with XRE-family HTH domain
MAKTDTDTGALAHALGAELQALREARGWSRQDVAACSDGAFTARTLRTWEKATRSVTVGHLELAGQLYVIRPSELLLRAQRRIEWDPSLTVDLDQLAGSPLPALRPLAPWAREQRRRGMPRLQHLSMHDVNSLAAELQLTNNQLTMLFTIGKPTKP